MPCGYDCDIYHCLITFCIVIICIFVYIAIKEGCSYKAYAESLAIDLVLQVAHEQRRVCRGKYIGRRDVSYITCIMMLCVVIGSVCRIIIIYQFYPLSTLEGEVRARD